MSTTFLSKIEGILKSSKFEFSFEGKKLNVAYNNYQGFFSIDTTNWEPDIKKQLYVMLECHKNKTKGSVPDELKKEVAEVVVNVKEEPLYKVTKNPVYFDRRTFEVFSKDVDLSNEDLVKGVQVLCTENNSWLREWVFVKHEKKINNGISFIKSGFVFPASTPESKENPDKDALNLFINKIRSMSEKEIKPLLNKIYENAVKNRDAVNAERAKSSIPTNEQEAKAAIEKVIAAFNEDPDVFDSWGIDETEFDFDLSDLKNPSVKLKVNGFLFDGIVKLIHNTETKDITVELIDGEETLMVLPEIYFGEILDVVDRLVEYEGDQVEYAKAVLEEYGEDQKLKAA